MLQLQRGLALSPLCAADLQSTHDHQLQITAAAVLSPPNGLSGLSAVQAQMATSTRSGWGDLVSAERRPVFSDEVDEAASTTSTAVDQRNSDLVDATNVLLLARQVDKQRRSMVAMAALHRSSSAVSPAGLLSKDASGLYMTDEDYALTRTERLWLADLYSKYMEDPTCLHNLREMLWTIDHETMDEGQLMARLEGLFPATNPWVTPSGSPTHVGKARGKSPTHHRGESQLTPLSFQQLLDFASAVKSRYASRLTEREQMTLDAFVLLGGEEDGGGEVRLDVLKSTIEMFRLNIDVDAFVAAVDTDGNGMISFDEFSWFYNEGISQLAIGNSDSNHRNATEDLASCADLSSQFGVKDTKGGARSPPPPPISISPVSNSAEGGLLPKRKSVAEALAILQRGAFSVSRKYSESHSWSNASRLDRTLRNALGGGGAGGGEPMSSLSGASPTKKGLSRQRRPPPVKCTNLSKSDEVWMKLFDVLSTHEHRMAYAELVGRQSGAIPPPPGGVNSEGSKSRSPRSAAMPAHAAPLTGKPATFSPHAASLSPSTTPTLQEVNPQLPWHRKSSDDPSCSGAASSRKIADVTKVPASSTTAIANLVTKNLIALRKPNDCSASGAKGDVRRQVSRTRSSQGVKSGEQAATQLKLRHSELELCLKNQTETVERAASVLSKELQKLENLRHELHATKVAIKTLKKSSLPSKDAALVHDNDTVAMQPLVLEIKPTATIEETSCGGAEYVDDFEDAQPTLPADVGSENERRKQSPSPAASRSSTPRSDMSSGGGGGGSMVRQAAHSRSSSSSSSRNSRSATSASSRSRSSSSDSRTPRSPQSLNVTRSNTSQPRDRKCDEQAEAPVSTKPKPRPPSGSAAPSTKAQQQLRLRKTPLLQPVQRTTPSSVHRLVRSFDASFKKNAGQHEGLAVTPREVASALKEVSNHEAALLQPQRPNDELSRGQRQRNAGGSEARLMEKWTRH